MKPIKDFPGYFGTEDGQVWSEWSQRFLRPALSSSGYLVVTLHRNGKQHTKTIHRLIAETFLKNPENKREVNHKDGKKQNNHTSNLEWATRSENNQHAHDKGLNPNSGSPKRPIEQWLNGFLIQTFASTMEAERAGFDHSHISAAASGKHKHHAGFRWRFVTPTPTEITQHAFH